MVVDEHCRVAQKEFEDDAHASAVSEASNVRQDIVTQPKPVVKHQNHVLVFNCFINKLADETLADIFFILVEDETAELEYIDDHTNETTKYPWILTAICWRWRIICLGISHLWSFFNLWTNHDECNGDARVIEQTILQLERSRNASLFVHCAPEFHCMCDIQQTRCDVLMSHIQRWKWLTYEGAGDQDDIIPRWIPDGTRFPSLRALHLGFWDEPGEDNPNEFTAIRAFARMDISWQSLTYLRIAYGGNELQSLLQFISQCCNVTTLCIRFSADRGIPFTGTFDAEPKDKKCIIFPHATEVSLTSGTSYETHFGIDYIQIPAVEKLELSLVTQLVTVGQVAMRLIQRSRCSGSLQNLRLSNGNGTLYDSSFAELLKLCPNLRFLDLTTFSNHDATPIIQLLDSSSGPPNTWLCPQLQALHLYRLNVHPKALIEMVDPRLQDRVGVQQLRSIVWYQPRPDVSESEEAKRSFEYVREELKSKYEGGILKLELH